MANQPRRRNLQAVSADIKLRAALKLQATSHGQKMEVADRLAQECGRARRSILQWQTLYKHHGSDGLLHGRSDRGLPRLYSEEQFNLVIQASCRIGRSGNISREFKKLKNVGLPGGRESFRLWIHRVRRYGYVETDREAVSA